MEAGQVIAGKYRLNKLLGTGGMASVWSATNIFTEREFAIKFMLPAVSKTPEAARRFLMEAKVSARVNHPNVIEIVDVGQTEDGTLFLVMELLAGMSLDAALRRQNPPMSVYEFVGIMLDVARALYAAHNAGVVHRDLKPTNIFLHKDREGIAVPKLLDFGVSKFLLDDDRNNALTVAGTVLGSPLYMSPEQAMGHTSIDGRTDIFAFGAILFEGLCGFRCYDAPNFNALIVTIATTQPKDIDQYAPQLPAPLRQVVKDCLTTDRNKRVASFGPIIERLAGMLSQLEQLPYRLPTPVGAAPPSDPDATNALPAVVRPSDRPPPPPPTEAASPPGGFSPWQSASQRKPASNTGTYVALGAAVLLAFGILGGVVWYGLRSAPPASGGVAPPTTPPSAPTSAVPSALPSIEPPSVDVSSLPTASPSTPKWTGMGKLKLTAPTGSYCAKILVDGVDHGPSPVVLDKVPAGPHTATCENQDGKIDTMQVTVFPNKENPFVFFSKKNSK
jgi:serine/threonine-protein kinase